MSRKTKINELIHIEEPAILFGYNQACVDPRDGLTLFGPLNLPKIYGIRSGVVATKRGLEIFKRYLEKIQRPVYNSNLTTRPMFPGFEAVFDCKWEQSNILFREVTDVEIGRYLFHKNTHTRTYDLVGLFIEKIITSQRDDEAKVDVWFVIIPDDIYKYCRPNSVLPRALALVDTQMSKPKAKKLFIAPSLFIEENVEAEPFKFDAHFHDQLKARLLPHAVATQIFRESTLAWSEFKNKLGNPIRDFSKIEGHLAWTVSTATYYKAGGKPWKLANIRKGVCYLGLVYKRVDNAMNTRNACCAAQMFLDSGDGTVFKGEVGAWYNPTTKEYHLDPRAARALLTNAIKSYASLVGENPREVFIHSKTRFNSIEWQAFLDAKPAETKIVGIVIEKTKPLKLYRTSGRFPILRGSACVLTKQTAFLWTLGYVPRLQTAIAMEVPSPLFIEINKGETDIVQVLHDIMALTKLNYNACLFGDGSPVTLRFANSIGEILTASMDIQAPPLAFKYYI